MIGRTGASLMAVLLLATAARAEHNGDFPRRAAPELATSRIIIGLRAEPRAQATAATPADRVSALAARARVGLRHHRAISPALELMELDAPVEGAALADTLARLQADPDVAFAEPDGRAYRHAVPTDPRYPQQWYLQGAEVSAINAEEAWDTAQGSSGVVVAVLDTGVRFDHPDLLQAGRGGRLLPGYDFVGSDPNGQFRFANDGDGWDPNPADPGDWVSNSESQTSLFIGAGCDFPENSSWHGTRVAGMIGAITNNDAGIAGGSWAGWILPVRVLGKCGGDNSDILSGMRWAAGLHVDGVPDNPNPARVINMSLGATASCTNAYQSVVDELTEIGVLVVASAGNEDGPVDEPANCDGVAAIAGLRHIGTKVKYSSFGQEVALSAPGGNCVNTGAGDPCLFSLDSTSNSGATAPASSAYTDQFDFNVGTSFAAPQVTGIAALMLGVNGKLHAPQLLARLEQSARPFPPLPTGIVACQVGVSSDTEGCGCTLATCGTGMADAPASVAAARRPVISIALPSSTSPGQNVVLDATSSGAACGRNIATWSWGGPVAISGADTPVATVTAPASGGSFSIGLTITDDQGAQESAEVFVTSNRATTDAPAFASGASCLVAFTPPDPGPFVDDGPVSQQSSGGGGGGSLGWTALVLLAPALRRPRRI